MISLIALVASSTESKTPSIVRHALRDSRVSRTQTLVTIASVPSLPTSAPVRSSPGGSSAGPPNCDDRAVGQSRLRRPARD